MIKKEFIEQAKEYAEHRTKISLVKLVKDYSHLGLRECKCDIVDEVYLDSDVPPSQTPTQLANALWKKMRELMLKEYGRI